MDASRSRPLALIPLMALLLLAGLPAMPAAAACPAPGGAGLGVPSPASSSRDFVFAGRGWGHGVGMSQYGAQGAAELGCSSQEIVQAYYRGVELTQRDTSQRVRVGLAPGTPTATLPTVTPVVNEAGGPLRWRLGGDRVASQPQGATWQVRVTNTGRFVLAEQTSSGLREVWQGGSAGSVLTAPIDRHRVFLPTERNRYGRGTLEFVSRSAEGSRGEGYWLTAVVPDVEQYLYGLAEMPSSFPEAALEAQAIVGRSYTLASLGSTRANCRCQLYDTVYSQVYAGLDKELEGSSQQFGRRWVAAVDATRGRVMTHNGRIATGNYASSHGGHSDAAEFVWGSSVPWLQPVDDSRWNRASSDPNISWEQRFSRERLGAKLGIGVALSARVIGPRGAGGRVGDPDRTGGGLQVVGTRGTALLSGNRARTELGLKSTRFAVSSPPAPWAGGIPVAGDWDGDGTDQPGWFDRGTWWLSDGRGGFSSFGFGSSSDRPIVGDWDGDGIDTVGVRRGANRFYLRNANTRGPDDVRFVYGSKKDRTFVIGDWDGDGDDTPGVVRGNRWLLSDSLRGGTADHVFRYGSKSDREFLTGDWNGDGRDGPAVVRGNAFYLKNGFASGIAGRSFRFGRASDDQLAGDFNGSTRDRIAVARGSRWYVTLDHAPTPVEVIDVTS